MKQKKIEKQKQGEEDKKNKTEKDGWNLKRELARKFVHLLSSFLVIIYLVLSQNFNRQIALFGLVLILIVFLEFEYLRIEFGRKIPILSKVWEYTRRKKEEGHLGGDVYLLIGAILVFSVYDLRIAIAALLMTTFGDMAASLVGQKFGKHQLGSLNKRTWEGTIAEFIMDLIIGFLVFGVFFASGLWEYVAIVIVMAVTATLIEAIIYKIDDNLLIPIFSGFNGQIVLFLIKWF